MSRVDAVGLNLAKCVVNFTKSAFPRFFSVTASRGLMAGNPTCAKPEPNWARRKRGGEADRIKYHPIVNEIKDEEKLREYPRCSVDFLGYEVPHLRRFKSMPQYQPYFEPVNARNKQEEEKVIKLALQGRDTYEALNYLTRTNFGKTSPSFRQTVYEDSWRRSASKTPTDLELVLRVISAWIRIGVKPANLFSEAFGLLPENMSRETVMLCAFYRGLGRGIAHPRDDAIIFPVLEDHLLAEGSSLTMPELEVICRAFVQSCTMFSHGRHRQLSCLVEKRFLELLPTRRWNENAHCVWKLLLYNKHHDLREMRALHPALEDSEFFEFCLERPREGMRDLAVLTGFLFSRTFKDGPLLVKCVNAMKILCEKENSRGAKIEDVTRLFSHCTSLDVELDDVVGFVSSRFRRDVKSVNGKDHLTLLEALAVNAIFPRDLIDALFSSKKFMRVEDGRMPGINRTMNPSIQLIWLDTCVELMCPDYAGARLPAEVRKLALDHLQTRALPEEEIREAMPGMYGLADALNKVFNESGRTKNQNFVSIERPIASSLLEYIELDEKNKPIARENSSSRSKVGKPSSRKIAILTLVEKHFLTLYDGDGRDPSYVSNVVHDG